jgi:predicted transcriptional regulator/transcriptional regulator with XRE-family HTH domain
MANVPEGFRIRKVRKRQKMTQSALAKGAGISTSYLNLIEHNRRPISGKLLNKIARILATDVIEFSGYEDARLIQDLTDLGGNPLFRDLPMDENGAQNIIGMEPGWGRAMLRLHDAYNGAIKTIESLSDRFNRDPFLVETSHEIVSQITAIRSFAEILADFDDMPAEKRLRYNSLVAKESSALSSAARAFFAFLDDGDATVRATTPSGEVEDFIDAHENYFPVLEQAAEALQARVENFGETKDEAITNYLARQHGITINPEPDPEAADNSRFIDYRLVGCQLDLLKLHPPATQQFLIAQFIFEREHPNILDELTADRMLTSDDARARARRAMVRYAAGALLFPYKPFLNAAIKLRYDIQALRQHIGGSFEQIVHRLTTLRAPGSAGIPFLFMRTDLAGNISKRFSLSDLHLPRYGGACPLWGLYRAFLTPGQIIVQKVQMPNKQEFLFVARTVIKQADSFGTPKKTYSVMFGCDLAYADQIVYGEVYKNSQASLITEVGSSCRLCPRQACVHRAHAAILSASD